MKNEFPRGSEWRRWDLHVHTASSYDYKYKANDADDVLCQALRDNEVIAVAITDHFVIEKVRIEHLRQLAPKIVFFPGVELRTDKGDTNIHVILIFSPDINLDNLQGDFDSFKRGKATCLERNERIFWDYRDITNFAVEHDALISLHAGSKVNGLDNRIVNTLDCNMAIKEDYAKSAHIFEMGKEKDLDGYNEHVFKKIARKPMIICSDNHDPREYNPKAKLWIKADPTFEGLKQILCEPEERVCISDTMPETKPDYHVINSVTFNDPDFPQEAILFNDKLTCIIGGKSTGKSILLHNLAVAIDKKQVDERSNISKVTTKDNISLTVSWKDKNDNADKRNIIYIPQTYLNKLCDSNTEKTDIDTFIQKIVLYDSSAQKAFDDTNTDIHSYKTEIDKKILDLIEMHKSIEQLINQMREIGNKEGIVTEISKLKIERERLSKESDLSEDEIKRYDVASHQIAELSQEIAEIEVDITLLSSIESLVKPKPIDERFSTHTTQNVKDYQKMLITKADTLWQSKRDELLTSLTTEKHENDIKISESQKVELELKGKIKSSKMVSELIEKISVESKKLLLVEQIDETKKQKQAAKDNLLLDLASVVNEYKRLHMVFADAVNENQGIKTTNLQFKVEVPFRKNAFFEKFESLFDKGKAIYKETFEDFNEEQYTSDRIKNITQNILSGKLKLKGGNTPESALRELFGDWYEIKYKVTMDGDSIDIMSPGKKALVLLKLLIELDDSKCPILVDQPEDDLDNRSISKELIPFIRKKKTERQIIVVTHNANIVVGADAEEVIVANQCGNDTPNKKYKFEYRSGAIENNTPSKQDDGCMVQGVLNEQGIQQHICDILEGGKTAFELRKMKYQI